MHEGAEQARRVRDNFHIRFHVLLFSVIDVQHTLNSHIHHVRGVEYRVIIAIGMPFSWNPNECLLHDDNGKIEINPDIQSNPNFKSRVTSSYRNNAVLSLSNTFKTSPSHLSKLILSFIRSRRAKGGRSRERRLG